MDGPCVCGHSARDHFVWDLAETVTATVVLPDEMPRELRVMRTFCRPCRRKSTGWPCVLYTPTALLVEQLERVSA